jgi:hypothetical protein
VGAAAGCKAAGKATGMHQPGICTR